MIGAGLQTDIIDELESHLMHAFDDWKVSYHEADAFERAVENLGTPATILDSFAESVSLPLAVKFSISYVVLLGVGMGVLASLSLDNPAFEYGLAFCVALLCYCAYWLIPKAKLLQEALH